MLGVMDMSDNVFMDNESGWKKFTATGDVFDYLNYKHISFSNGDYFGKEVDNGKGVNCEDRSKGSSC